MTPIDTAQEAEKALSKAKVALMSDPKAVFFCTVALSVDHYFDDSVPTACTNGLRVIYNTKFFMEHCSPAERVGLILHEVLHIAFKHMLRLNGRNPEKWNAAADYVINLIIVDSGFKLPSGGLLDRQYEGMSADQVYGLLPDDTECAMMDLDGSGAGAPMTQEEEEQLSNNIDDILVKAVTQANASKEGAGNIPGELARHVDKLLNPPIPWHKYLRAYFNGTAKTDYTYRKPNRRFLPDYILPTAYSEALGHVAEAFDCSGSVDDYEFAHYNGHTARIIDTLRPEKITLLQFDTKIKRTDEIRTRRELEKVDFHGRGGTNIEPVLSWAKKHTPKVLLVFSDGYFHLNPEHNPRVPVIWVIHDNPKFAAPFGKVIHFNMPEED